MYNKAQIERNLFEFVEKNSHVNIEKVSRATMLFQNGIFDSMGFIVLVDFIQDRFNIKIADEDLVEQNFESIEAMTRFVQGKLKTTE